MPIRAVALFFLFLLAASAPAQFTTIPNTGGGGGGATSMNDLTDVDTSATADGCSGAANEFLIWNFTSAQFECWSSSASSTIELDMAALRWSVTDASITTTKVEAELKTQIASLTIPDPTSYVDGHIQLKFPFPITITRLSCSTDAGTVDIQFDERVEATPNTAGTDISAAALQCDSDNAANATFTNAAIAADAPLNLDIDAVATSPGVARIFLEYTID